MQPRQNFQNLHTFRIILFNQRDAFLKYNSLVGRKCKGIILKGLESVNIDRRKI